MRMLSALLAAGLATVPAAAQSPAPVAGGRTASLGQPGTLHWTSSLAMGRDNGAYFTGGMGLQRDLLSPMLSVLALHGEVFLRSGGDDLTPGVRARMLSPFVRVGIGADYQPTVGSPDLLLSAFHPVRRGGLFADGSVLRIDYLPGRDHAFTIGFERPVMRRARIGRSRPARDHVRLPTGRPPARSGLADAALSAHIAELHDAARAVRLALFPIGPVPARRAADNAGVTAEVEPLRQAWTRAATRATGRDAGEAERGPALADVYRYHHALELAFSTAIAGSTDPPATRTQAGIAAAAVARRILLDDVLLPYNRLLGQTKKPDGLSGLSATANSSFTRWLHLEAVVAPERRQAMLHVFNELLAGVDASRASIQAQWRDNRFVWLPLQYALRPDEHETQAQLDAIIERAVGARFTDGNFVSWVVNEQFQYQLSRTIRETNTYHVLWTHDFRGFDAGGDPDEMSYHHVLRSYLAALTQRVQDYDRTGRLPTYMIVMDQWFYEVNHGRLWMTLLEDPLGYVLTLPPSHRAWQDSIAAAQRDLRAAVEASSLLQYQARLHGSGWLRNLVKVHVNITNPADPSFWSRSVLRGIPLPDNMMRDHRKIVFYDITEEDPYSGEALFTGAGIGEHYASLSWEDRSVLVRGPSLLPLKGAVRELLLNQGLSRDEVPHALVPLERPPDYDARIRSTAERNIQPLRALQVHNGAGYDAKDVSVVKAILYTLMPPGSVTKIPDSLWNSDFWASMLLGCALRGGRVLVIAPSGDNAPVDAFGTLGRSREVLGRVVAARNLMQQEIDDAGGTLRIGIYYTDLAVTDIPEKVRLVDVAFGEHAWLRSLFNLQPAVLAELTELSNTIRGLAMAPDGVDDFEHDSRTKLHLKANFFASAEAWSLMNRSEWAAAAWEYMQIRIAQVQMRSAAVRSLEGSPDAIADAGGSMVIDWFATLDEHTRERVIFYTLMGSHNQNSRSIVIDAEVGFLISQWPAVVPYIDLIVLLGQTQWIDAPDDLAALLPLDSGWKRRLAHWVRLAM
jgi:hypothetical protein